MTAPRRLSIAAAVFRKVAIAPCKYPTSKNHHSNFLYRSGKAGNRLKILDTFYRHHYKVEDAAWHDTSPYKKLFCLSRQSFQPLSVQGLFPIFLSPGWQ